MNKAATWALVVAEARERVLDVMESRPEWHASLDISAYVCDDGQGVEIVKATITSRSPINVTMSTEAFIAMCRWGLETFDEPTP